MKQLITTFFLLFMCSTVVGQLQFEAYRGGQLQFNTYPEMMSGKTELKQVSVALRFYGNTSIEKWMVTVKLDQDYLSNGYAVPAEQSALTFNSQSINSGNTGVISPPSSAIPLSRFQETPLIISDNVPITNGFNRDFYFNFRVHGGNHLLTLPNHIYQANFIFTLYEMEDNVPRYVATCTAPISFQLNYEFNHGTQLVSVESVADSYQFIFRNPTDLVSGQSITRQAALKVRSYQGHELLFKASKEFMQSSESEHILPVSVVNAHLSLHSMSGGSGTPQILTPLPLKAYDQVAARFPGWSNEIVYNLTLSVTPNQSELIDARGHYETLVYFVIIPW
jgi:hypothetical protein